MSTQQTPAGAPPVGAPPAAATPAPGLKKPWDSSRSKLYAGIAIALVLALIGVLVATSGSDGPSPGEVFLEPAGAPGPDAFTESVDTSTAPPPVQLVPTASPSTAPPSTASPSGAPPTALRSVQGAAPGLYGGTHGSSPCDSARLVSLLQADPAKAAAWAGVQGITPAAIRGFIQRLTPVVLRADTRVTDHAYRDGRAVPRQAILQAGTSVLVGGLGRPRVRCASGSPLSPARPQRSGVTYTGDPWPEFRPTRVIVVVNTIKVRVTKFVLVDLVRPGYFVRPVGIASPSSPPADGEIMIDTFCDLFPEACRPPELVPGGGGTPVRPGEPELGSGDVQITLRWNTTADLDLAVIDPTGELINYDARISSSGGQLDVDSNGGCENITSTPVENVFWPQGQSPDGTYKIIVTYFGQCPGSSGPQSFELFAYMGGSQVDVQGMAARGGVGSTFEVLVAHPNARNGSFRTMGETGTLNEPSDYVTGTATKEGGAPSSSVTPPPAPDGSSEAGATPGSITLHWEFEDVATEFELTMDPGGTTFFLPGDLRELTIPGLEPGVAYTFSLVAVTDEGRSEPATITRTAPGPGTSPPGSESPPPPETAPPGQPTTETLEEYCNRVYGPPPTFPAENMQWALCMHDPTSSDIVDEAGSLPISAENA